MTGDHPQDGESPAGGISGAMADLAACIRFFSRLPVPCVNRTDNPASLPDFSRAAWTMPLAGAVLALPGALVLLLAGASALPDMAVALLAVGTGIAVTGGLHEDGLADVADGFFGAGTAERRLEIMKDSRIGAFGTLALILSVLLKVALVAALLERHAALPAALLLVCAEAGSRAVMAGVWSALPPARPGGLASLCGTPSPRGAALATAIGAGGLLAALAVVPPAAAMWAAVLALLSAAGLRRLALAKIGGHTGDVLGAAQQLAVLSILLGFCAAA
ncbi:adenosylcobinamide-GDP ribazoletransferase [Stappia sp. MMSF_3263]|uniref:adenosylcobinamide-GDP ribazoletransferase n=1 Tax=Stappia sp. MMSF_3263 TaxID=3046693 RepID=UPI00273D7DE7|nr:adenosylcobinamide-GDP ribazoletransferase [Stappia sp. MMSF_3263]